MAGRKIVMTRQVSEFTLDVLPTGTQMRFVNLELIPQLTRYTLSHFPEGTPFLEKLERITENGEEWIAAYALIDGRQYAGGVQWVEFLVNGQWQSFDALLNQPSERTG
jgi:hypothetical protein